MFVQRALRTLLLGVVLVAPCGAAVADATTTASYVVNLGGTNIATAKFRLADTGNTYDLALQADVSGVAQLVASGTAQAESSGTVTKDGLASNTFALLTKSGGQDFSIKTQYASGTVSAFVVNPPIVNNIDRVPLERKQLSGVNDMLAVFVRRAATLDKSVCDYSAHVFTGIERFDLAFSYAKDDVATSPRTGYQGPVVLCRVKYTPISGHYTTSEITNSLAQDDRILIWYAPLKNTGYAIPYRVLLTTSMGDLSLVLTSVS